MIHLGLIGRKISHSQSEIVYRQKLAVPFQYDLLDFESSSELPPAETLLSKYRGLSITSPYKKHYLSQVKLSDSSLKTMSVNCLYRNDQGEIEGANTDYLALHVIIPLLLQQLALHQVVILGSGVMSGVVRKICEELDIDSLLVARSQFGDISGAQLEYSHALIVNCCSRSMLFSGSIQSNSVFYDLNYGLFHPFIASSPELHYIDGMELLTLQAQFALRCWKLLPA